MKSEGFQPSVFASHIQPTMALQPRQDLLVLENRLLTDVRNFGFLLAKLPRNIFIEYHGHIVLNPEYYPASGLHHSPVFAHFSETGTLEMDHQERHWVQPNALDPITKTFHPTTSGPLSEHVFAIQRVPFMSWITQSFPGNVLWEKHIRAFIDYSLLNYAFDSGYIGHLPQPDYENLSQLFTLITKTQQYKQLMIMREDEESAYLAKTIYAAGGVQDPELSFHSPLHENWTANMSDGAHEVVHEPMYAILDSSSPEPTPTVEHQAVDFDASTSAPSLGNSSETVRDHSTTIETSATPDNLDSNTPATTVTPDTEMGVLDDTSKLSPAVPEPAQSNTSTVQADPELTRLHASLGHEVLSFMPELSTMVFHKVNGDQAGFLPLRLMLGTFKQTAHSTLAGHKVWAFFKIHAVNAKAASAPRMHVCARHKDTDVAINDNVKLPEVLSQIDFIPILSNLDTGKPGDMQLKAIIKYYYILAANAKLHSFEKHYMPVNNTFVEQLRTVCDKQKNGNTGEPPRKRRRMNHKSSMPTSPDSADVMSADTTQGVKRASRRTRLSVDRPSTGSPAPGQHSIARPPPPRKLALGIPITQDGNGKGKRLINEFLADDIEPRDSDGESGDEIPARIPDHISTFLRERREKKRMFEFSKTTLKQLNAKKESGKYTMRSLKGQMTRGTAPLERLQRDYKCYEQTQVILASRIKVYEGMVRGFGAEHKAFENGTKKLGAGVERVWDAYQEEAVRMENEERKRLRKEALEAAKSAELADAAKKTVG